MSETDDPWKYMVLAQRANLTERDKERVLQRLPPRDSYIGVSLVQRITSTNVSNGHVMKIPMAVADNANMEHLGTIGVGHGEAGRITRVPFNRDKVDCRVVLNSLASREFHEPRGLDVGCAILITMGHSDSSSFDMMMVIN